MQTLILSELEVRGQRPAWELRAGILGVPQALRPACLTEVLSGALAEPQPKG